MTTVMSFVIKKQRWKVVLLSQQELNETIRETRAHYKPQGACADKPDCAVLLRTRPSLDTIIHEITHAFWFTYGAEYRRIKDRHEQIAWFFGKHGNRIVKLAHKIRAEMK